MVVKTKPISEISVVSLKSMVVKTKQISDFEIFRFPEFHIGGYQKSMVV